jgi:transposase-like protein
MTHPDCHCTDRHIKNSFNPSGLQRWRWQHCRRVCTPEPKPNGYAEAARLEAVRRCVDGMNYLMTAVDRAARCIVGVAVVWARTIEALQTLLDARVWAWGHQAVADESQTCAVESSSCAHLRCAAHVQDFVSV